MFIYLLISRESHFQFHVLPHVRSADNFTAHYKAYKIPVFVRFKTPVTGFDFCKRSHHYLQGDGSGLSQNDSNCSRVAQHALVLGPGQSISSDSLPASTSKGSGDAAFQWSPSQKPPQSESACLVPRASFIQEQGFTDEVAARIEAPQKLSTRAVYKSKWAIFVKWCDSHEVDFR